MTTFKVNGHRIQRSICLRNVLWLPNLVIRTPDQSINHYPGHSHKKGNLGSSRGLFVRKAVWSPNLIQRTLTRVLYIAGVKDHVEVIVGQPEVNVLRNTQLSLNLVRRTHDKSVMNRLGQRSSRGPSRVNQRSICQEKPYGHQIWSKEYLGRMYVIIEV